MFVELSSCKGNCESSGLVFEAQQIQLTMPMNTGRWASRYVAMNGGKWCVPRTTKSNNNKNEKNETIFWGSCLSLYQYLSFPFSSLCMSVACVYLRLATQCLLLLLLPSAYLLVWPLLLLLLLLLFYCCCCCCCCVLAFATQ